MARKKKGGIFDVIGDVVDSVSDAAGDVVGAVGDVADKVTDVASDAVGTTYEVASSPESQAAGRAQRQGARRGKEAERKTRVRQRRLVNRYAVEAYKEKAKFISADAPDFDDRVAKAKSEVADLRTQLLSDPAVKQANSRGKVVAPKGLQKLSTRRAHETAKKASLATTLPSAEGYRRQAQTKSDISSLLAPPSSDPRRLRVASAGMDKGTGTDPHSTDPLRLVVDRDVEAPAKAAGVLPKEKTFGQKAYQRIAEYGPLAIGLGPEVTAATKGLGAVLKGVGSAEGRVAGSKLFDPTRLATPGQQAAVSMRAAERAGAKGLGRIGQGKADRALVRQLTGTQSRREFSAQAGLPLQAVKAAGAGNTEKGQAIGEGALKSVAAGNRGETFDTTLRALPAVVTGPAALAYTALSTPWEGTGPLEETAKAQYEGLARIGRNLLSGDPEKTQEAFQEEGAWTLLAGAPALTRTRAYKGARTQARAAASAGRRATKLGRQTPKGMEVPIIGALERSSERKRTSIAHSRASNPRRISEGRHTHDILYGKLNKPSLAAAPKGTDRALSTLLEYGIRDMEGVKLVRENGPETEPHMEGRVNLDAALKAAEDAPEMFTDKAALRALHAAKRASDRNPSGVVNVGNVSRYRAQGDLFGVLPPDKAVPTKAREYTSAKDRDGAWKDVERMEARIGHLKARRAGKGPKGKAQPRRNAEVKALERRVKNLKRELDPYTRPGQKTARGERLFWDKEMEREYIQQVKTQQDRSPLVEPAWTHHGTFRHTKEGIEGGALPDASGGASYVRRSEGGLAESDLVDRSIEAFIRGTVEMPRRRASGAEFGRHIVRQEKVAFTLGGKKQYTVPDSETWAKITSPKTKSNPDGGQIDPKHFARFPVRQWGTAVKDPYTSDKDLLGLLDEAEMTRNHGHEPSLILPREVVKEFAALVNPSHEGITAAASKASTAATRAILTTNPAWALAQIPAEGIPLLLAHPELLNPYKVGSILHDLNKFRKENPEEAAVIEGVAGASPYTTAGSLRSPLDLEKESVYNPQPAAFADGAKALNRGPIKRGAISALKLEPLGLFDVKRQNIYRTVLLAAEADKQFRGFTSGVRGYFKQTARISENFRGKSREEMWTWLTTTKAGKAELDKLANYVDNIQGNWTAFTRYERAWAPLAVFYPFLRYSLRWTLWTFPKTHPVTATIAFMLGQANSNALENLLGAKPASALSYSQPVTYDSEGEAEQVLPGGSRISPGQSSIQQALASRDVGQLTSSLNPILSAISVAAGGPGPFGVLPAGPKGWAAVDQLLHLPAPLRAMDVSSEQIAAQFGIGRVKPETIIAKAYKKLDPEKGVRSLLNPAIPQPAKEARMSNELTAALKLAKENSKALRSKVAGDDSLSVKERQKKIGAMEKRGDKAAKTIDKVLKTLGLDKEDAEAYERWKAAMYGGKEEEGIYGKSSIYDSIYEADSVYGSDPAEEKALKYKPPKAGGVDLPGLSGITGAIPDVLTSLVSGDVAQASTRKAHKAAQKKANQELGQQFSGWGVDAKKAGTLARVSKEEGVPAPLLAAIGKIETSHGTSTLPGVKSGTNSSGAAGPFQFIQSSWESTAQDIWGDNWTKHSVYDYDDAAKAAARYLKNGGYDGTPDGTYKAVFSYNHADWYVEDVIGLANQAKNKLWAKAGGAGGGSGPTKVWQGKKVGKVEGDLAGATKDTKRLARRIAGISGVKINVWNSLRPGDTVASGQPSDHASGQAMDIEATSRAIGGSLADEKRGDKIATAAYIAAGGKASDPEWKTFINEGGVMDVQSPSGYRTQIIWKTPEYGGHEDHVHVGIRPEEGAMPGGTSFSGGGGIPSFSSGGGSTSFASGSPIPGMSTSKEEGKKQQGMGAAEKLKLVNEITSGDLSGLGIPGFEGEVGTPVSDIAALGRDLESRRRKLLTL